MHPIQHCCSRAEILFITAVVLQAKLVETDAKLSDHDREMRETSEKLSECEDELDAVSMDHEACEDLIREEVVTKVSQLYQDTLSLKATIADLEDQIPPAHQSDGGGYQDYDRYAFSSIVFHCNIH